MRGRNSPRNKSADYKRDTPEYKGPSSRVDGFILAARAENRKFRAPPKSRLGLQNNKQAGSSLGLSGQQLSATWLPSPLAAFWISVCRCERRKNEALKKTKKKKVASACVPSACCVWLWARWIASLPFGGCVCVGSPDKCGRIAKPDDTLSAAPHYTTSEPIHFAIASVPLSLSVSAARGLAPDVLCPRQKRSCTRSRFFKPNLGEQGFSKKRSRQQTS